MGTGTVAHTDEERVRALAQRVAAAGLDVPAELAIAAVLGTLGEVLPFGTAGYLAANLPAPLRACVGRHFPVDDQVESIERSDFEASVAARCGRTAEQAPRIIAAVTGAVAQAVPLGVMADVRAATPESLLGLLPPPAPGGPEGHAVSAFSRSPH